MLAAILVLAGSSDTALEGAALLAVYSLGLAIPFVLVGAAFTRMMGAFRWLRDHYRAIQFAGGLVMVVLGLLLFFGRFYVLRIYVNRALEWSGSSPSSEPASGGSGRLRPAASLSNARITGTPRTSARIGALAGEPMRLRLTL